jgi:NTP pyrophosphatase (non-canonical NTP hydrolase)
MHLNEYQHEALSFRLESADEAYALFGLVGEVGELYSFIAKTIRDNPEQTNEGVQTYVKKELGDILWMLSAIAADHGLLLEDVARGNIEKLSGRAARGTIQGSGDER